jgi:hypothetical protein
MKSNTITSLDDEGNPIEWGYLLLEDTPVHWEGNEHDSLLPNQWYTVRWGDDQGDEGCSNDDNATINNNNNNDKLCPKCQFMVFSDKSSTTENGFRLPVRPSFFSPTTTTTTLTTAAEPYHPCNKCSSPADGVLLQHIVQALPEHVHVVESQILFLDNTFQRAAFYVTLTLPTMGVDPQGRRALVPNTAKPLSGPWQLLLTLLRTDWYTLEELYAALQDGRVTQPVTGSSSRTSGDVGRRNTTTLFPPKVTMPALYERLPATPPFATALQQRRRDAALAVQSSGDNVGWTRMEEVIWQRHVAPFLTAADVDALPRTCRYWNDSSVLRRVVPGLRLALYQHQITSLAWMRQREHRTVIESDCDDAYYHQPHHGMDLHRAITAGATVRLRARRVPHQGWRVDTLTGKEHPSLGLGGDTNTPAAPRRRVARGGLLIDDPGLGKTITVLALILQTAGLTTQVSSPTSHVPHFKEPDDDTLFASYWRENVPEDFARQDLLKLVNQIDRRAPRGFWSCGEIRKRVDTNAYAANFESFQQDVE